jgi:hypothetical protein
VLFELIFVSLFLLGWLFCAFLPWLALSVATRGNAGIGMLPLCLFTGVVAALAVPLLISDDWTGVWLSFIAATLAPAALMTIRRLTAVAPEAAAPASEPRPQGSGRDSASAKPVEGHE